MSQRDLSKELPYGDQEIEDILFSNYSPSVRSKGRRVYRDGGVVYDTSTAPMVFKVSGSQDRLHRVQIIPGAGVTCSCDNGSHRGGDPNCNHTAAVFWALLYALRREDHDLKVEGEGYNRVPRNPTA